MKSADTATNRSERLPASFTRAAAKLFANIFRFRRFTKRKRAKRSLWKADTTHRRFERSEILPARRRFRERFSTKGGRLRKSNFRALSNEKRRGKTSSSRRQKLKLKTHEQNSRARNRSRNFELRARA